MKDHDNRIAKRHFDTPPTQKMVHGRGKRSWGRINTLHKNVAKWCDLEARVKN
jgi:hypothetical protein